MRGSSSHPVDLCLNPNLVACSVERVEIIREMAQPSTFSVAQAMVPRVCDEISCSTTYVTSPLIPIARGHYRLQLSPHLLHLINSSED